MATFQVVATTAKLGRLGELAAMRNGDLERLLHFQDPEFVVAQAEALADYTQAPADEYLAGRILAMAAMQPGAPLAPRGARGAARQRRGAPPIRCHGGRRTTPIQSRPRPSRISAAHGRGDRFAARLASPI